MFQDDDGVPMELRTLPEYKELLELKRLKKQKLHEIQEDKAGVQHVGYKVKKLLLIRLGSQQLLRLSACPKYGSSL